MDRLQVSEQADFSQSAIIPADDDTSAPIDCGGMALFGILIPTGFEGTGINIEGSLDGENFYPVCDADGVQYSFADVVPEIFMMLVIIVPIARLKWVRLVSNATETSEREIKLLLGSVA
jgi:hypothetical protein